MHTSVIRSTGPIPKLLRQITWPPLDLIAINCIAYDRVVMKLTPPNNQWLQCECFILRLGVKNVANNRQYDVAMIIQQQQAWTAPCVVKI